MSVAIPGVLANYWTLHPFLAATHFVRTLAAANTAALRGCGQSGHADIRQPPLMCALRGNGARHDPGRELMAAFTAVPDSIMPVNALQLVLRHYLAADVPPVEEPSFWSSEDRPLEFEPVDR